MVRALATFAFLVFATITTQITAHAETLTLGSTYAVTGTNPDGSAYKGTVNIEIISDTTFAITWKIGDATYQGFGMRQDDSLAATYTISGEPGLVIYHVEGKNFDGLWAIKGHSGNGTEHLTPAE